jgi:hypothetical protein
MTKPKKQDRRPKTGRKLSACGACECSEAFGGACGYAHTCQPKREPFERWSHEEGALFYDGIGLWPAQLNKAMDLAVDALNAARITLPKRKAMTDRRTKREREGQCVPMPSTRTLLKQAEFWQIGGNGSVYPSDMPGGSTWALPIYYTEYVWPVEWRDAADMWASAALSEVCWHRGHAIVNADGTDVEPVTSFTTVGGVRGEDGTERPFYGAARRLRRGR